MENKTTSPNRTENKAGRAFGMAIYVTTGLLVLGYFWQSIFGYLMERY